MIAGPWISQHPKNNSHGAGTPEVMTLVYKAVQRGYAVVAMGAHRGGDKWRCYETHWPPEEHPEIPGVCHALHHTASVRLVENLDCRSPYDGALGL